MKSSKPAENSILSSATHVAGVMQSKAYRNLKREVQAMLTPLELTMTEWFAVGLVHQAGSTGLQLNELATQLDTSLPFITKTSQSLVKKQWLTIIEDSADKRVKRLVFVPSSKKRYARTEEALRQSMRAYLYTKVSREDLAAYLRVLYALADSRS